MEGCHLCTQPVSPPALTLAVPVPELGISLLSLPSTGKHPAGQLNWFWCSFSLLQLPLLPVPSDCPCGGCPGETISCLAVCLPHRCGDPQTLGPGDAPVPALGFGLWPHAGAALLAPCPPPCAHAGDANVQEVTAVAVWEAGTADTCRSADRPQDFPS